MMDPEPGRCRRTDGKKWRCSKNVIPDQKYCERHMHRGRQRSRKHVEEVYKKNISESKSATNINCAKTTANSNSSIEVPAKLEQTNPSSDTSNKIGNSFGKIVTTSSSIGNSRSHSNVHVKRDSSVGPISFTTYNSNNKSFKINRAVVPGFEFSPKSVLQHSNGFGTSSIDHSTVVEADPQRCRRTDGKKWQCNKDVLPEQKYCGNHMHRGAKKLATASDSVVTVAKSPPLAVPKMVDNGRNVNTRLSISLAASPQQTGDNENDSIAGSSSDATTVTDENASISHVLALSP